MNQKQETVQLKTLSKMFDIPLWTLRAWASKRTFPGIIKRNRSLYVVVERFREWFYKDEVKYGGLK